MKKLNINTIKKLCKYSVASLMAILFASGMLSCEIGLGPGVDMQAPVVKITSHQDNDSVAQTFVLRGTASDNEGITNITIDFEDADIHYKITPGDSWQKKTPASGHWVAVPSDNNNYCKKSGDKWKWAVAVDTGDKSPKKKGSTFNLVAVAEDDMGNSGKDSKIERSLIVDTENPFVSIYNPDLFTGTYEDINGTLGDYTLQDGNKISRLLNGTVSFKGRQSNALSFKELRIEFDNGELDTDKRLVTTADSVDSIDDILALPASDLGDSTTPDLYFSKTLKSNDLREWTLSVKPEEWATNDTGKTYGLDTGKHLIRVVTTSLSTSNAWERKVIGYFIWYPEADRPWINIETLDDVEKTADAFKQYPGSNITGSVQDDDGIKSFVSTLYKKEEGSYKKYVKDGYENPKIHEPPKSSGAVKYYSWGIEAPSDNGQYMLELTVTDINGNSDTIIKYFQTDDVSAPKINITSPLKDSTAIISASGNITFKGEVTDDGEIKSFTMVWLDPAKRNDSQNKIKYLTGTDSSWDKATTSGYKDNGNIIYKFDVGSGKNKYQINKTFNLFTDLKIGETLDNEGKVVSPLVTQDFIFRAQDNGGNNTVVTLSLSGDTSAPTLRLDDIELNGKTKHISDTPTFDPITNGDKATITGIWEDYFRDGLKNTTRIHKINISWGNQTAQADPKSDGSWSVKITAPAEGGTITASIQDYGGNKRTVQGAVRIDTNEFGLARIGCNNDDKSYKQGNKLELTLEFTKNTDVTGTPKLKLNNGEYATYKSGSGTTSHIFEYEVAKGLTDQTAIEKVSIEKLSVDQIITDGVTWNDHATGKDVTNKITIGNLKTGTNLADTRFIKIDTKKPRVDKITAVTEGGWYNKGSILFMLEFDEDVEITDINNLKIQFKHKRNTTAVTTDTTETSGSKAVLLTYKITAGDNAKPLTFDKLLSGATVTDLAGNTLSNWTPKTTPSFSGINIVTTKPNSPTITKGKNSSDEWCPLPESDPDYVTAIFDDDGTTFAIKGTSGNKIEYTTDGRNWLPYTDEVTLSNNGNYTVSAKQIDQAGNESDPTTPKKIVIDKGSLLTRITASTVNGTYSSNTSTKKIEGKIEFRKTVTIAQDATVTLNVKRGSSALPAVPIKTENGEDEAKIFTFDYTIEDGDSIDSSDGLLDVTGWSITTVTFKDSKGDDVPVELPFSSIETEKKFKANRQIKVITGKPKVSKKGNKDDIEIKEEKSDDNEFVYLYVKFDREIEKVGGKITITQKTSNYHVPAKLTAEEYKELSAKSGDIAESYHEEPNGATLNNDGTLTKNTATSYILDFSKNDTNSTLVSAFTTTAKQHIVEIPVVADEVEIYQKNYLRIDLTDTYKLPVKGAEYYLTIPKDTVTDAVQNKNDAIQNFAITAPGVEPPVIRIQKSKYTIGNPGNTATPNVDMTKAQTAKMRIDCQTPGATKKYDLQITPSPQIKEDATDHPVKTQTDDPKAPTTASKNYTDNQIITLANEDTYKVDSYDNAKGIKIAILATANDEEKAYEFAARTVLKFRLAIMRTHAITLSVVYAQETFRFG